MFLYTILSTPNGCLCMIYVYIYMYGEILLMSRDVGPQKELSMDNIPLFDGHLGSENFVKFSTYM